MVSPTSTAKAPMFALVIHEKGGAERREMFEGTEISVGRVQGNDLMLPKGNVSKRHARLLYRDGRYIVTDLNSTNGTYVNRRRITQATIVREGDRIYIGDFILRIETATAGSSEASAAVPLPSGPPRPPLPTVGDSQPGATARPSLDDEEELTRSPVVRAVPSRSSPAVVPDMLTPSRSTGMSLSGAEEEPTMKSAVLDAAGLLVERVARLLPPDELEAEVGPELASKIDQLLRESWSALSGDRAAPTQLPAERVLATARAELIELGPLGDLLSDPTVTELAIVAPDRITVSRGGRATLCEVAFSCALSVRWALVRLCARASVPLAPDATRIERRFSDGTTLSATLSPGVNTVAVISRSKRLTGTLDDLVRRGTASRAVATFLQQCLLARLNILVVGPRDGGMEQLLGAFAASLSEPEVVYAGSLTVERPGIGSQPLGLDAADAIALVARAPYVRLFAELSSAPVTEAVIGAACDGADGMVIARTATSLRKGVLRVASELRPRYGDGAMEMLASAFEIVIEVARLRDERHRVLRVAEVLGADGNDLTLSDVFAFSIDRTATGGLIEGSFAPASNMPAVADLMRTRGAPIDSTLFTRPSSR